MVASSRPSGSVNIGCKTILNPGGADSRPDEDRTAAGANSAGRAEPLGEAAECSLGTNTKSQAAGAPLVSSAISRRGLEVYPVSVKIVRPSTSSSVPPPVRSAIDSFSDKSRRRLRFTALNAFPALSAQFGMTYPETWPDDGRIVKRHLDNFLHKFRRRWPDHSYLWIFEFQRRGAPHFHLFTSLPVTDQHRHELAAMWVKTICGGNSSLLVHDHSSNFIKWEMRGGSYLCKYLEKQAQKCVPEQFLNVGRFWGASRGIVPEPVFVDAETVPEVVDRSTGEVVCGGFNQLTRWIGRLHEKQTRGFSMCRKTSRSYTVPVAAQHYKAIERYYSQQIEFYRHSRLEQSDGSLRKNGTGTGFTRSGYLLFSSSIGK